MVGDGCAMVLLFMVYAYANVNDTITVSMAGTYDYTLMGPTSIVWY